MNPALIGYLTNKTRKQGIQNIKPLTANAEKTDLPQESVDIVFLHLVFHDIKNKHAALKEFYRVLKENGKLVIDEETLMPLGEIKKLAEDSDFMFLKHLRDCPNFRERKLEEHPFLFFKSFNQHKKAYKSLYFSCFAQMVK